MARVMLRGATLIISHAAVFARHAIFAFTIITPLPLLFICCRSLLLMIRLLSLMLMP